MWVISAIVFVFMVWSQPSLKILVLEGEDGVNIIRQNTAAKPIVEVRDQNDLPVAGAAVLFILPGRGPGGTFANGTKELSVTTDSTGRAAATEWRPSGRGVFRMEIRASYQGQSATTSVTQNNFNTAEDAQRAGKTPTNSNTAIPSAAADLGTKPIGVAGGGVPGWIAPTIIIGEVAAIAGLGTSYVLKKLDETQCSVSVSSVLSAVTAQQQLCTSGSSPSPQCLTAVQNLLGDLGSACSCQGQGVPAAYQQFLPTIRSTAQQYGLRLPSSCGL
jgi:hypothetical protein